jgi:hypothetical protein
MEIKIADQGQITEEIAFILAQRLRSAEYSVRHGTSERLTMLKATLRILAVLSPATLCLPACQPYPDDGEFLAGVVFSGNFMTGVRSLSFTRAVGRGRPAMPYAPYVVIASTGDSRTTQLTATAPATAPLWRDATGRDPLLARNAQKLYSFDQSGQSARQSCKPTAEPEFDRFFDLVHPDRQYPIFTDLPEVLQRNAGRAGRRGAYSAIVEVVRLTVPPDHPCQSLKRAETVEKRIMEGELRPVPPAKPEYRLMLIIDTELTRPLSGLPHAPPYQLGWFDQLVVPFLDMGPVPVSADGTRFLTMPLLSVVQMQGMPPMPRVVKTVVTGAAEEEPVGPPYSPVCQQAQVAGTAASPNHLTDSAYAMPMSDGRLFACLVCHIVDERGSYVCPFAQSTSGAR